MIKLKLDKRYNYNIFKFHWLNEMKLVENDFLKHYWDLETGHVTLGRQLFLLCPP